MRILLKMALVAAIFSSISGSGLQAILLAQVVEATLIGRVTDPSGAVMTGVTVIATSKTTSYSRKVSTDDQGNYTIPSLQPGIYEVSAELPGFKKAVLDGIDVKVGRTARVDISMVLGEVQEQVVTEARAPLVETEKPAIGAVIDQKRIVDLPLNGRNFMELATLTTGINEGNSSSQKSLGRGFGPAAAGQPATENSYNLDGGNNQEGFTNVFSVVPSVDAVQEFNIQVGQYSAEYGGGGGAVIDVVTRSGSNNFHGTAFEFIRNDVLDARNFFLPEVAPFKRNQFGASAGGAIVRDKTFFFGNYEGLRFRRGLAFVQVVPTALEKTGDLSSLGKQLRDPILGGVFPGGVIPDSRIDPISRNILAYWPLPNNPSDPTRNFIVSPSSSEDGDSFVARIDHNLSTNHTLYGRYAFEDRSTFSPGPYSDATEVGGLYNYPNFKNLTLKWTSILKPTLINEFRFSDVRTLRTDQQGQNLGNPIARQVGLGALIQPESDQFAEGFIQNVNLQTTRISSLGETQPTIVRANNTQFQNLISWNRGAHGYKFGVEYQDIHAFARLGTHSNGNYTFNGTFTGDGFADFLLGWPSNFLNNIGPNFPQNYDRVFFSGFFVDDWQVNRKLTLNLGVRYELETVPRERDGNVAIFDPALGGGVGGLAYPEQNTIAQPFFATSRPDLPYRLLDRDTNILADLNNIAPRFGFAYRPTGGTKTVIRGGYGWFYSSPQLVNLVNNMFVAPPMTQWPSAVSDPNNPQLGWNRVPVERPEDLFKALTFGLLTGSEQQFLNGYTQQWSLTIDREIGKDIVIEAQYLGSKSTKLETSFDENFGPPSSTPLANKVPFPRWGRIFGFRSGADANYNAMMVSAEKRFSGGLTFKTSWTVGKAIADHGARKTSGNIGFVQNPGDLDAERSVTIDDVRNRVVAYWIYELPFGPGKAVAGQNSGALGKLIGGWRFSGIFNYRTAFPLNVTVPANACNSAANNECRPNVLDIDNIMSDSTGVDTPRFNRSAFQIQTFAFGSAGPNLLRGNSYTSWDLALGKDFRWSDRHRIEFRFEMFNGFNHPNFADPVANVSSPLFGRTFSALEPRNLQFGLKFYW